MISRNMLPLRRRSLLKAGGAMVIGFSFPSVSPLQAQSSGPPDAEQIDSWIAIHEDSTATVFIGFAELGQGCSTALLQVAAEELDLDMDQVSSVGLDTHITPNQGGTYSSSAMRRGAPQVQQAAAEARLALLEMSADRLQVPLTTLSVRRGIVSSSAVSNQISYGDLIGGQRFDLPFSGSAPLKSPENYRLVASPQPRKDIPLKAGGNYPYMQHQRLPGMLHGRIVRPRGQGAYRDGVRIVSIDEGSLSGIDARVLRRNNFLVVVAAREWDAVRAAERLQVSWQQEANLPGNGELFSRMQNGPVNDRIAVERGDTSVYDNAAFRSEFAGTGPYQAHVPFAPNCALADVAADSALVLCSTQDVYNTRTSIANLLELPVEQVRVQYHEGAGTFGHSCWDDAAQAAALASQLAGAPVRLQLMRWDEHGWDTYGPAHVGKARVAADGNGRLVSYEYEGWQHHWALIETSEQTANGTAASEWPPFPAQQINPLVLGGMYDIPNMKLTNHHVDGLDYLKGAWLRSPMDLSLTFISEQAIDDLAWQLNMDPYRFRRNNISDPHWLDVLDAAAAAAGWQDRRSGSEGSDSTVTRGRGIGLGTHLASWGGAVAEVEVNRETGKVRIVHLYGAIDAGLVVNPANVENQIIGQLVQTASRMLLEEVTFDERAVTSLDWNSYPILRFEDCPEITPVIVQRLNEAPSGAGEEVMAAAACAIANAFFDATGRRMSMYPFTPARVLAALA